MKVNLCKPFPPDSGATADVRIVESLVRLVRRLNEEAAIYVVESNSNSRTAEKAFKETGYRPLEEKDENLHLVNLSKTSQITIRDARLRYFKDGLKLSSMFFDCDYFISIAKLKTHEFERFTGILKNQFGCLSTKNKEPYHPHLGRVLGDINTILRPDLCIIDGIIAMEGKGPTFGRPKQMGLLIIGNDPVATDAVSAKIIGVNPQAVPHLRDAARRGLGEIEIEQVNLMGKGIGEVASELAFIPSRSFYLMRSSLGIHGFAQKLSKVDSSFSFFGNLAERLARSLYIRSVSEIVSQKMLGGLKGKIKTPRAIIRFLMTIRLAIH